MLGVKSNLFLLENSALNNATHDLDRQLSEFAESLKELLVTMKAGDWERFSELSGEMGSTMAAIESAVAGKMIHSPPQRARAQAILSLLDTATHECSTRKEQILPLIEALTRVSSDSARP